jgi:hypothetical protein
LMIVVFPPPNVSPAGDTTQSPSSMDWHAEGMLSDSSPG